MSTSRSRLRWLVVALTIGLLAALAGPALAGDRGRGPDREVTVMTRNLYFGADLEPVLGATSLPEFLQALSDAFDQAVRSNFPLRMDAVAGEIAESGAWLVGMQEVATWTVEGVVVADFTEFIIQGLDARGLHYEAVAVAPGFQFTAPIPGVGEAGLAIADVILARTDLSPSELKLSNPQSGTYTAQVELPTALGPLPFPRQWASIDAKVRGKQFRFVSTHLESVDEGPFAVVRPAQASELLTSPTSPLNTTRQPVVLVGDFNSEVTDVGDAADLFLSAGLGDAWATAGTGPGYTYGHDPDLAVSTDGLEDSRIDFVMVRGGPVVEAVTVVDTMLAPSTDNRPLWPSDHGGVVATVELKPR
jgi:endonuclease/exonuclease/phosphatase family metal-dependent hydrolase